MHPETDGQEERGRDFAKEDACELKMNYDSQVKSATIWKTRHVAWRVYNFRPDT